MSSGVVLRRVDLKPARRVKGNGDVAKAPDGGEFPGPLVVIITLLVFIGILGGLYYLSVRELKQEVAATEQAAADSADAQLFIAALQPFQDLAIARDSKKQAFDQLSADRFDYDTFMRNLANIVPDNDVSFETVSLDPFGESADAGAGADPTAAAPAAGAAGGQGLSVTGTLAERSDLLSEIISRMESMEQVKNVTVDGVSRSEADGGGGGGGGGNKPYSFNALGELMPGPAQPSPSAGAEGSIPFEAPTTPVADPAAVDPATAAPVEGEVPVG